MKSLMKPTLWPHRIPWGHRVGLMSLFMIHKAYMHICWTDGTGRTDQPKVVEEGFTDLKKCKNNQPTCPALARSSATQNPRTSVSRLTLSHGTPADLSAMETIEVLEEQVFEVAFVCSTSSI